MHGIIKRLQELQRKNFYRLTANVKHSGHYYHEFCTKIDVNCYDNNDNDVLSEESESDLKQLLREFMQWSYRQLENEYDYLTSEECIEESIRANEMEFDEFGNLF